MAGTAAPSTASSAHRNSEDFARSDRRPSAKHWLRPHQQPLRDRAERILKDLESRKTTGLAAMDLLAALAAEKDAAAKAAKETVLSPKDFAVFWALRDQPALRNAGVDLLHLAKETEAAQSLP